ncbi:esterase/lipase family protein [Rhizosphaericola mali]|uniref:triacylglycerol lipase n=1 Tax=Rhizosphaericola mali TaxID=2545455 RepID=A0A5P2FY96_9BACT|nr:triacylglycerol lipase [Rhizosphaericola mali]QES87917.1 triacylglycerol lipase [Rhizosphaericola mali]
MKKSILRYTQFMGICTLLGFSFSCQKKEIIEEKFSTTTASTEQKEAVKVDPTTSLRAYSASSFAVVNKASTVAANGTKIPIVFTQGLFGFGREELLGLKYWGGGFKDLQEILKSNGYPTYTSNVGPISSNYDRAIELFYQIKGGSVDYGKAHSDKFGHLQKVGKTYPGLYPEWDKNHPIHLIGHSMGGQTIRYLLGLLEKGSVIERSIDGHAPIFDGNRKGWVKSITTISTPNSGTSLENTLGTGIVKLVKDVAISLANLSNTTGIDKVLYNFDIEQWGMNRDPNESFLSYVNKIGQSKLWASQDEGAYDLSIKGAMELNEFATTSPDVYYFALCTKATNTGILTGWEYPKLTMFAPCIPLVYPYAWPLPPGVGNYTNSNASANAGVIIDKKWWANDGLANTYSMRGPIGSKTVDYTPNMSIEKGTWYAELFNGYDHFDIVGLTIKDVTPLYLEHAKLLSQLQ